MKKKATKVKTSDPKRMSYESYAALRKLIQREQKRLEEHYQIACWFLPTETYKHGTKSTLDKVHGIFMERYHELTVMEEELHIAAACTYKDHPNPEMRKFWGIK